MACAVTLGTRTELSLLRGSQGAGPCPSHTVRKWQSYNHNPVTQTRPTEKHPGDPRQSSTCSLGWVSELSAMKSFPIVPCSSRVE